MVLYFLIYNLKNCSDCMQGERGLVVGRWTCNPEDPGSNPPPFHWMDLSSVTPNSTPPCFVNSQLVSLPPVGNLNLLCLICIIFVCYAHLIIFTWNLCDINVNYYYWYYCASSCQKIQTLDFRHWKAPGIFLVIVSLLFYNNLDTIY